MSNINDNSNKSNNLNKSNKSIINDLDYNYNKRQFWTYKRLYSANKFTKVNRNNMNNMNNMNNNKSKRMIFHLVNDKIATDRKLVKRLTSLYIPPAYKDLVVAKSANNKIQVIGTDNRGRRQYIYNPNFTRKRNDRKWDDILELAKKIGAIEKDNQTAIEELYNKPYNKWSLPMDYIPIIIYMLRTYHFRIGNERYFDENSSYGITTLRAEHIKFLSNGKFKIEFIGKKGILNSFTDDNIKILSLLKKLIHASRRPGHNGFLFKYNHICMNNNTNSNTTNYNTTNSNNKDNSNSNGNVNVSDNVSGSNSGSGSNSIISFIMPDEIQSYFHEKYNSYITPKMFRTWYGNFHLLGYLRKLYLEDAIKIRPNKQEKNEIVAKCSEHVSSKLNNTPTVSKQSYIDNKILDLVMRNPYRLASKIPDTNDGQHRYLFAIIKKVRNI